jgi:predicted kinase
MLDLEELFYLDIVLICGLPACGKSQFAKTHFKSQDFKRINRKEIRRLLYEMTNFEDPWSEKEFSSVDEGLVKQIERKLLENLLQNDQKILVDNTSVSIASRKSYIQLASQFKKSIGVVFMNTPVQTCMERNRKKTDPVPERIISNLAAAIELPDSREGFKEIAVIKE